MWHATGTENIMIVAAAEFAGIGCAKLLKFSSLLNLKVSWNWDCKAKESIRTNTEN